MMPARRSNGKNNPDYQRAYYAANREELLAKYKLRRAARKQDPELAAKDKARLRARQQANKARYNAYRRAWRSDPAKARAEHRRDRYGVSATEQLRMLTSQGHKCAACGDVLAEGNSRQTHLDHDHKTGEPRSFLCRGCNLAIGNLKDSPGRARKLAEYLERWTAALDVPRVWNAATQAENGHGPRDALQTMAVRRGIV